MTSRAGKALIRSGKLGALSRTAGLDTIVAAIEQEVRDDIRALVEAMVAYHPHEAPYVGGDASLPCIPAQCAGGMRLAVLAAISSSDDE